MIRDRKIKYYTILGRYIKDINNNKWFTHVDSFTCLTLNNFNRKTNTFKYKIKDIDQLISIPRNDPTSCGFLWQKYGISAVTNIKAARKWLLLTRDYHETLKKEENLLCEFKIAKIEESKKTTFVE